jgi:hypothetical protein
MQQITLSSVLQQEKISDIFQLPLSEEAYNQYCEIDLMLRAIQGLAENDSWKYIWGNGHFSDKKAYNHLMGSIALHPAFRWLWSSSCQPKHKVFYWLLLKNRLNTRGLLRRKNMMLDSYSCEICILQKEEKLRHLFFRCPFAKNCWNLIGVQVPHWLRADRATRHLKRALKVPFAMEIIILMCWCIWSARNGWVFNAEDPGLDNCKQHFKREFALVILRAKPRRRQQMQEWLNGL